MSFLRALFSVSLILAWAFVSFPAEIADAAPPAVDCGTSSILFPTSGAAVAGTVEIRGRANVPGFRFYKVESSPVGRDDWVLIGSDVIRAPVQEGRLVVWQTTIVQDGAYRLRMHVVDPTGNYCEIIVQPVFVSNSAPPLVLPTETAAQTETPIVAAVPTQATMTPPATLVTDYFPVQTPALPIKPGVFLPDLNLLAFGSCFLFGACGMGAVIGIIALANYFLNRNPNANP